jgi:hypothetical protein
MKIKYVSLSIILAVILILPTFGQQDQTNMSKPGMKIHDMSGIMGKPTAEATVDGLNMKVWLVTQQQHKKMMYEMGMSKMKDSSMKMDKAMKDRMMVGTHHIMLVINDSLSENNIDNILGLVLYMSPSGKSTSVDLKSMMNHFGGSLTLDEKGEYLFKVSVDVAGVTKSTQFKYIVN